MNKKRFGRKGEKGGGGGSENVRFPLKIHKERKPF